MSSPSAWHPRKRHALPHAVPLLARLPGRPGWVAVDRRSSRYGFRQHIREAGAEPALPSQRDATPVRCPDGIYANRNRVERPWARLKARRVVATRYENAVGVTGVLDRIGRRKVLGQLSLY